MNLETIKSLIRQSRYREALAICDEVLKNQPDLKLEIIRQKSHICSRQADYKGAVRELELILDSGRAAVGDYNSAAFWSLFDDQPERALKWYLTGLERGERENDEWFKAHQLFLIAYIHRRLENYEAAKLYIDKAEAFSEEKSFLVPVPAEKMLSVCETKQLRAEINRGLTENKQLSGDR